MHIDLAKLQESHGDKALALYKEIAVLVGGDPSGKSVGGIDLTGCDAELKKKVDALIKTNKDGK